MFAGTPKPLNHNGNVDDGEGWKVARLVSPAEATFAGLSFGRFGLTSIAVCEKNPAHEAPVVGCECGFHSLSSRGRAEQLLDRARGLVLLHVEMYGDIVVHREGSRAAEQDVNEVFVKGVCASFICRRPTTSVRPLRKVWVSACDRHAGTESWSLNDLRQQWRIDVSTL